MRKASISFLLLAAAPLLAQLPSHTLTIAATRSIVLQPDQIVFVLSVNSPVAATLEQVAGALSGLGITSANVSGVDSSNATTLQWNFTLASPLANLTATIASLTKLEQTIAQNGSGLTLTFYIGGTQVSQRLRQSQTCSNADLISDATAQAQKLAAAAGMTAGPIVKLSNTAQPENSTSAGFLGVFLVPAEYIVPNSYSPPVTCSLSVQFQLLP